MSKTKEKSENTGNFFQRLFDSIFKSNDPEFEKKRMLKNIYKDLNKTKYKFYRYTSEEVLPGFARLFFTIYKTISPCRIYFPGNQNPNLYKTLVINALLSDKQIEIIENLREDNIMEEAKSTSLDQLQGLVREQCNSLYTQFDSNLITRIDTLYSQLMVFKAFCEYDYYFLLRKFCSSLQENNFSVTPTFEPITGRYIVDDLQEFINIAWGVTEFEIWNDLFTLLKQIKSAEGISKGAWNKIVNKIREIRVNHVFEMMLKLIMQNPVYEPKTTSFQEHIAEKYIESIQQQAEKTLSQIKQQQRSNKIDNLVTSIFGTTSIERMKNYTESQSSFFERKKVGGYIYHQPMNYMRAFLLDYIKKDVRELADLLLVRGKWTSSSLAAPMSEAYNNLLEASNKIIDFDNSLDESSQLAMKLKNLGARCDRDKEAANILHTILNDVNSEARGLLISATQDLITLAKNLKFVLEDKESTNPQTIINWKELEHFADFSIKDKGVDVYKQLHKFVLLMKGFLDNKG